MNKEFDKFIDGVKNIDLNKMESKLDDILANETSESLTEWILSKKEISDEEIYKASRKHITDGGGAQGWIEAAFRQGAVWYREQLKLKLKGGQDEEML